MVSTVSARRLPLLHNAPSTPPLPPPQLLASSQEKHPLAKDKEQLALLKTDLFKSSTALEGGVPYTVTQTNSLLTAPPQLLLTARGGSRGLTNGGGLVSLVGL